MGQFKNVLLVKKNIKVIVSQIGFSIIIIIITKTIEILPHIFRN